MTQGMGGHSPSNILHHLKGTDFPAKRDDLVAKAKANDAEPDVLDILKQLPDQEYHNMAEVLKGIGKVE